MTWECTRELTRCTGHCCRAFTFGLNPVEIGKRVLSGTLTPETKAWFTEALVYLGEHLESPSGIRNHVEKPWPFGYKRSPPTTPSHWYSCRWFDGENCTNYNNRPATCRDYPYCGCDCQNPGCTRRTNMAEGLSWWKVVEPPVEVEELIT